MRVEVAKSLDPAHWPLRNSVGELGLLEDEDGQGGAYEVAAHGEAEKASQTEQRLAVGAHSALGVLEGLVLVGTDVNSNGFAPSVETHLSAWRVCCLCCL